MAEITVLALHLCLFTGFTECANVTRLATSCLLLHVRWVKSDTATEDQNRPQECQWIYQNEFTLNDLLDWGMCDIDLDNAIYSFLAQWQQCRV